MYRMRTISRVWVYRMHIPIVCFQGVQPLGDGRMKFDWLPTDMHRADGSDPVDIKGVMSIGCSYRHQGG